MKQMALENRYLTWIYLMFPKCGSSMVDITNGENRIQDRKRKKKGKR